MERGLETEMNLFILHGFATERRSNFFLSLACHPWSLLIAFMTNKPKRRRRMNRFLSFVSRLLLLRQCQVSPNLSLASRHLLEMKRGPPTALKRERETIIIPIPIPFSISIPQFLYHKSDRYGDVRTRPPLSSARVKFLTRYEVCDDRDEEHICGHMKYGG